MTEHEKRVRLAYLRFKMKSICLASFFFSRLRKQYQVAEEIRLYKKGLKLYSSDSQNKKKPNEEKMHASFLTFWHCIMSLVLWYNLISSPLVILWPELSLEEENKSSWYMLWGNELFWTLDIVRKFFNKRTGRPINDTYELA